MWVSSLYWYHGAVTKHLGGGCQTHRYTFNIFHLFDVMFETRGERQRPSEQKICTCDLYVSVRVCCYCCCIWFDYTYPHLLPTCRHYFQLMMRHIISFFIDIPYIDTAHWRIRTNIYTNTSKHKTHERTHRDRDREMHTHINTNTDTCMAPDFCAISHQYSFIWWLSQTDCCDAICLSGKRYLPKRQYWIVNVLADINKRPAKGNV